MPVTDLSGGTLRYVLVEHKSTPNHKVGWQLLRYLVEILKQWERSHPNWDQLPAIVPFVFYHGPDEWKIPDELLPLVDAEQGWRPYLPNFRFPVLDLGRIPDRVLSADYRLQAWLLATKYTIRKAQQIAIQGLLIEALRRASEDLRPIIHYLIQVYCYDEQTLRHIIHEVRPEEEAAIMSQFAQDIRQKALQEGIQQGVQLGIRKGRLEGEARLLLRILPRRFGPLPTERSPSASAEPTPRPSRPGPTAHWTPNPWRVSFRNNRRLFWAP